MKYVIVVLTVVFSGVLFGQKKQIGILSNELNEISGLEVYNDTLLIAHNDGGHSPILYFIDKKGKIQHQVEVDNATNVDWEDITIDTKGYIYIADIGNNLNMRKDLCIYKINGKNLLTKKTIAAEKIQFSYAEQKAYPPEAKDLHFDAEGMAFSNDSLYIFTKCRTEPFDGKLYCYKIPAKAGVYVAQKAFEYTVGKTGWWKDSVTGAEIKGDTCYLLTYDRILVCTLSENKLILQKEIPLGFFSQKEAITVTSNGTIYLADEKQKLVGGGNLYIIKNKTQKK